MGMGNKGGKTNLWIWDIWGEKSVLSRKLGNEPTNLCPPLHGFSLPCFKVCSWLI